MILDKLPAEDVQDWKEDATTQAFVAALKADHQRLLSDLEIAASGGNEPAVVNVFGGRCAQLRSLIRDIENAKGKEAE